jgi:hypothetical protein
MPGLFATEPLRSCLDPVVETGLLMSGDYPIVPSRVVSPDECARLSPRWPSAEIRALEQRATVVTMFEARGCPLRQVL